MATCTLLVILLLPSDENSFSKEEGENSEYLLEIEENALMMGWLEVEGEGGRVKDDVG